MKTVLRTFFVRPFFWRTLTTSLLPIFEKNGVRPLAASEMST